ncbi:MAG: hypothetical protein WD205_07090, partial [Rhodothermales bacterium]
MALEVPACLAGRWMGKASMDAVTPREVILCEVGPRDGFQYEEAVIPTDLKVEVVRGLAAAGLPRIQVASFVHPRKVPQMADAEEVVARLADVEGVTLS